MFMANKNKQHNHVAFQNNRLMGSELWGVLNACWRREENFRILCKQSKFIKLQKVNNHEFSSDLIHLMAYIRARL